MARADVPRPSRELGYPAPQYTTPFTIAGPLYTVEPLANDQSTLPVAASSAYIMPIESIEPANTTPFQTARGPLTLPPASGAVIAGLAICQSVLPVFGSRAAQAPTLVFVPACGPLPPSLKGFPASLL